MRFSCNVSKSITSFRKSPNGCAPFAFGRTTEGTIMDLELLQVIEADRRGEADPFFFRRCEYRRGRASRQVLDDVRATLPKPLCKCGVRLDHAWPYSLCSKCLRNSEPWELCVRCGEVETQDLYCSTCAQGKSRSRRRARKAKRDAAKRH